jgi:chaperonin cofactor prefoldin
MGVIAQEIEKIFPDFVSEDENAVGTGETYKSVSYSKLNMIALKAIQELSAKVETLEARIAALEAT